VSLPSLLAVDSRNQVVPDESTMTSCGSLFAANVHSVNCPVVVPMLVLLDGATTLVATGRGPDVEGTTALNTDAEGTLVGTTAPVDVPPADGSNTAIFPSLA
jgi:hypothetical protein